MQRSIKIRSSSDSEIPTAQPPAPSPQTRCRRSGKREARMKWTASQQREVRVKCSVLADIRECVLDCHSVAA